MDKLKNILKSDTPTDETSQAGATGKITGQGSHFPHQNDPTSTSTQPTTVTGTEPPAQGPADVSAAKPDPVQASSTGGPEQGGSEHVSTVPAETVSATQPIGTKHEAQSYNVTNADFPKTESSVDGSGTAAIGDTTTYKSSNLPQGDPVSSVIDKDSSDPLSYKKPESGAGAAGVGAGAASAAAATAFASSQDRGPGTENPYRTTDIDPRVDGGAKANAPITTTDATTSHSSAVGGGLAAAGATTAYSQVTEGRSAQPQSTLTTTTDPTDRSAVYSQATASQGLDEAKPSNISTAQTTGTSEEQTGVVGKVLGAVGLGGIAATAAAKLSGDKEVVADDTSEPVTTTGVTSYTSPTQQGPGTGHHRKESIPTTAYPAGVDSPGAINAPVGGTRAASTEVGSESTPPTATQASDNTTGHKAATAAAGAGAGAAVVGAAAVGNEHYAKSQELREGITGQQSGSVPPTTEAAHGQATTAVSDDAYAESKALRDNATSGPTATSTATDPSKKEDDHTARNTAIGVGAGAAVAGAGAAGAAEYSKKEAEKAEAEAAKQQAARQKEIEEQQKAAQKQAEKEQKAAEKEEKAHQKAVEKEEKKHQKEVEKEEKKHQKEIAAAEKKQEKEEKQHQKELEKEDKERQKQLDEEQERRRQAALAASAPAAVAAADTDAKPDHEKDVKAEEQEKKPGLLKRIFRRRKNSKTGEEEEYEAEEDDDKNVPVVAGAATGAAAGTAALASTDRDQPLSTTATETKSVDPLAPTQPPSQAGAAGFVTTGADGKPQYTVVPQPPPDSTTATTTTTTSDTRAIDPVTTSDGTSGHKPTDVLSGSQIGTNTTATTAVDEGGRQSLEERIEAMTHDKFGVVDDHKR